jgi:energy-coupling factor transporter ATP-binding protein EcfA2
MLNPFCSRFVRPGALPYLFPAGASANQLVERLRMTAGWGQIIGPYGTGKSTLLATLVAALKEAQTSTVLVTLHDDQSALPETIHAASVAGGILAVDGFEKLSGWRRFWLRRVCRRVGAGLLVTAQADVGLPTLWETEINEPIAWRIIARLTEGQDITMSTNEIKSLLDRHHGNLREVLFELYDHYEEASRSKSHNKIGVPPEIATMTMR